ncbi:MAG: peptide chain release factor N(5)-glutamine methyltransferase [Lachnospiraceae bacterium]
MNFREAITAGTLILNKANVPDSEIDARQLLEKACKIDRNYYYLHMEEELTQEQQKEFESLVKKRAERIPLQYITGEQEFMGLLFKVNSSVLIPRQDTEILVEQALNVCRPQMKVLDMCTGSGCIIISLAKYVENLEAYGVDVSKQALLQAKENARLNGVQVNWERSDLFENVKDTFDMILSNPPYIPTAQIETLMPEVRDFEPIEALDGKEDGLFFYNKIIEQSTEYLNRNGFLYLEIGCDQAEAVQKQMQKVGFGDIEVVKDLAGLDRVVKGKLLAH